MIDAEIKSMIKRHEAFRPYVYYDSQGYPTGGYGHAFLDRSPISHAVAELLFQEDFARTASNYDKLKLSLDPVRRSVVYDMLYNLGLSRFRRFKKMLKALRSKDYEKAADEMLDSLWHKQVGGRAKELVQMMRTGKRVVV